METPRDDAKKQSNRADAPLLRALVRVHAEMQLVTRANNGERLHWLVCEFAGVPAESWEVPIDSFVLEALFSDLEAVRIAPLPENVYGLDGTELLFHGHARLQSTQP